MVENHVRPGSGNGYLLVIPHQSMSWSANKHFLLVTGLILLTLAIFFAMHGLWLILPFAGLELAALGWSLYYTALRLQCREVITFTDSEVVVQRGRHGPQDEVRLPRHWSRFVVRDCGEWTPKRLWLRCHDREVELAARLTAEEKDKLIGYLRAITAGQGWQRRACSGG